MLVHDKLKYFCHEYDKLCHKQKKATRRQLFQHLKTN